MYFLLYVFGCIIAQYNDIFLFKKYQLEIGSSLRTNVMYLTLAGLVYAGVSALALVLLKKPFAFSWYSLLFATGVVIACAIYMVILLKTYEWGQIATAMIFSSMGSIILSCGCGIILLHEGLTVLKVVAILFMLTALILITDRGGEKTNKKLIPLYLLLSICASGVTMMYKYHSISAPSLAVDSYNFSMYVGLMRAFLFAFFIPPLIKIHGKGSMRHTRKSFAFAVISAVVVTVSQIMVLISLGFIPVSVASPLSTGIAILASVLIPWLCYHEKLTRRQMVGALFSLIGATLSVFQ